MSKLKIIVLQVWIRGYLMVKSDLVYQESFFYFSKISNHPLPACFDPQPYPQTPSPPLIWFYLMFQIPHLLGPLSLFRTQEY